MGEAQTSHVPWTAQHMVKVILAEWRNGKGRQRARRERMKRSLKQMKLTSPQRSLKLGGKVAATLSTRTCPSAPGRATRAASRSRHGEIDGHAGDDPGWRPQVKGRRRSAGVLRPEEAIPRPPVCGFGGLAHSPEAGKAVQARLGAWSLKLGRTFHSPQRSSSQSALALERLASRTIPQGEGDGSSMSNEVCIRRLGKNSGVAAGG